MCVRLCFVASLFFRFSIIEIISRENGICSAKCFFALHDRVVLRFTPVIVLVFRGLLCCCHFIRFRRSNSHTKDTLTHTHKSKQDYVNPQSLCSFVESHTHTYIKGRNAEDAIRQSLCVTHTYLKYRNRKKMEYPPKWE